MDGSYSRDETRAFAYWMSGSLHFAEEMADEAPGYAAARCRDLLEGRPPRGLPAWLTRREGAAPALFLEPFPDEYYPGFPAGQRGAVAGYGARESISLAFLAALQKVPVQARAVMVLHDLMGRDADGIGEMLGLSGSNLDDLLECARDMAAGAYGTADGRREPPPEDEAVRLLMRYIFSWESGGLEGLLEMLTGDVLLQLLPSGECHRGREAVGAHLEGGPLAGGVGDARGRWRLLPARANGQLAFGVYRLEEERRRFKAHSMQEIFFEGEHVSEIVCFGDPRLFPSFGFLPEVFVQG